jgi:hypothetical protein
MSIKKIILGILVLLAIYWLSIVFVPAFLYKSRPVESKILVVEGWISGNSLKQAAKLIQDENYKLIITTGGPTPEDVGMLYNGAMIFKCDHQPTPQNKILSVKSFGTLGDNVGAHYTIFVNNIPVGDTYVSEELKTYNYQIPEQISSIDSVIIAFDNDYFTSPKDDRNLYIRSIVIGTKEFDARCENNYLLNRGKKTPLYTSFAKLSRYKLSLLGVDSSMIVAVPAIGVKKDRTLTSAKALAHWIISNNDTLTSFNLFSQGIHARRSWLEFRHILGKNKKIGIIASRDFYFRHRRWWASPYNQYRLFREIAGNLFYQSSLITQIF